MSAHCRQEGNVVRLAYDEFTFGGYDRQRVTREFMIPTGSRYVMEWRDGQYKQVCARLGVSGSPLTASRETLIDVIRCEYNAMRRDQRKYEF